MKKKSIITEEIFDFYKKELDNFNMVFKYFKKIMF